MTEKNRDAGSPGGFPAGGFPGNWLRWENLLLPAAGYAFGFILWRILSDADQLSRLVFHNAIPSSSRILLLGLSLIGAALFTATGWIIRKYRPQWNLAPELAAVAVPAALLVILGIPAIEVFHPLIAVSLIAAFSTSVFFILRRIIRTLPQQIPAVSRPRTNRDPAFLAVIILSVLYTLFFAVYTVAKHRAFHSYSFDLGWQDQVFHTLWTTGEPVITGFITLKHLSNHFQPLYYLLSPLYAMRQGAEILLVLQAAALGSTAIPIYLFARKKTDSRLFAACLAVAFLLYPALHGVNTYDFHGIALIMPLFAWLLWALDSRRRVLYWVLLLLALTVREDTAVTLSGIGLYALVATDRRRTGLITLGACIAYFLLTMTIMDLLGGFANLENYWELILPDHQGFTGVLMSILSNPVYLFRYVVLDPAKAGYLAMLLAPVLFLPLFSGRRLILVLPGLAVIMLSGLGVHYSPGFQYSSHVIIPVFYLAACGAEEIRRKRAGKDWTTLCLTLLCTALLMNSLYGLVFSKRYPGIPAPTEREARAGDVFAMIPDDASVSTISRFYPHLSARKTIHLLHRMQMETDYVVADLLAPQPRLDRYEAVYSGHTIPVSQVRSIIRRLAASGDYGVIRYADGIVLLEKGASTADNSAFLSSLRELPEEDAPGLIPYYTDPAGEAPAAAVSESDRLLAFLRENRRSTVILVSNGDVATNLSYPLLKHLMLLYSGVNHLDPGEAYAAVIRNGRLAYENPGSDGDIRVNDTVEKSLAGIVPGGTLELKAVGGEDGEASVKINGREAAPEEQGLIAVVLDAGGNIRSTDVFVTGK